MFDFVSVKAVNAQTNATHIRLRNLDNSLLHAQETFFVLCACFTQARVATSPFCSNEVTHLFQYLERFTYNLCRLVPFGINADKEKLTNLSKNEQN